MNSSKVEKRLFLYIIGMTVLFAAVFVITLYVNTKDATVQSLGDAAIANLEKIQKDTVAPNLVPLIQNPQPGAAYEEAQRSLNEIREHANYMYLYVLSAPKSADEKITYIIDGLPAADAAKLGEATSSTDYNLVADVLRGEPVTAYVSDDEKWGQYLDVFTPLQDGEGNVYAMLAASVPANQVDSITASTVQQKLPIYLLVLFTVMALALLFIHFYMRRTLAPLPAMNNSARSFADGHLHRAGEQLAAIQTRRDDEISSFAHAFNESLSHLKETIAGTRETSSEVNEVAQHIGTIMQTLTDQNRRIDDSFQNVLGTIETQQSGSREVLRAMQEMTIGIQRVASSATAVAESSNDMTSRMDDSAAQSEAVVSQIRGVEQSVLATERHVKELGTKFRSIEEMVEVITNISDQTNLLALNAAIEAARAGESGKGFAVVADEVRKLAEMSRASAEEIRTHLASFEQVTDQALVEMEKTAKEVQSGSQAVVNIGNSLQHLLRSTQTVNEEVQETSAVVEQLSAGSEEVLASVEQMEMAQQESTERLREVGGSSGDRQRLMDELGATIEQLRHASGEMHRSVGQFRLTAAEEEQGEHDSAAEPPADR